MPITLFNNQTLKDFLETLNINKSQKSLLISKLPQMDLEERELLFRTLSDVYFLGLEEKEAKKKVQEFWSK